MVLIEKGDSSGDNQGCSAHKPQKKKNSAVQVEKGHEYGRKEASTRHEKIAATRVMSQQ
ncbi:MAG: hypothetical protein HIU83_06495 [Proteobacteria bacterium]|nr:hypothetical protein [Pseudomonadota bacterium]